MSIHRIRNPLFENGKRILSVDLWSVDVQFPSVSTVQMEIENLQYRSDIVKFWIVDHNLLGIIFLIGEVVYLNRSTAWQLKLNS